MFCRILLVFSVTIFHYRLEAAPAVSNARQFLPPIPGYIPVYIRPGNTPLEDINLDLAEAFKSYAQKQARLNSVRARSQNILTDDEKWKNEKPDPKKPTIAFDLDELEKKLNATVTAKNPQHIQKIKPKI